MIQDWRFYSSIVHRCVDLDSNRRYQLIASKKTHSNNSLIRFFLFSLQLSNCSNHGTCIRNDVCECESAFGGADCSLPTCADLDYCAQHGLCGVDGTCSCANGWLPPTCALANCTANANCNGRGWCVQPNVCSCSVGYTGTACESVNEGFICEKTSQVLHNGQCVSTCPNEYYASATSVCVQCRAPCDALQYESVPCNGTRDRECVCLDCSRHGYCLTDGTCVCDSGWVSTDCSQFSCNGVFSCYNHGTCT